MTHADITLRITRIPVAGVLIMARTVISRMRGNALFPAPTVPLDELEQMADELEHFVSLATRGSKHALELRNAALARLRDGLTQQADYVRCICKGDAVGLASSGFPLRKHPELIGVLRAPGHVQALFTGRRGLIALKWAPVRGAVGYRAWISAEDPTKEENWSIVQFQMRTGIDVNGLETGRYYWFRVEAMGATGFGPCSTVARNMAA